MLTKGSYFDRYIDQVEDLELIQALEQSLLDLDHLPIGEWRALGNWTYAEGKWTLPDIIQHIIDTERVFCYRTLSFARLDPNVPPGYNEDEYARNARASRKTIDQVLDELKIVRQSTIAMFNSFDETDLNQVGTCWKYPMNVRSMGYILAGHQKHHLTVIKERYLQGRG